VSEEMKTVVKVTIEYKYRGNQLVEYVVTLEKFIGETTYLRDKRIFLKGHEDEMAKYIIEMLGWELG